MSCSQAGDTQKITRNSAPWALCLGVTCPSGAQRGPSACDFGGVVLLDVQLFGTVQLSGAFSSLHHWH